MHHSENIIRSFELIAGWLTGCPETQVSISERLATGAAISARNRTIMFKQSHLTIESLIVCSLILRKRAEIREYEGEEYIPSEVVKAWIKEAIQRAQYRFRGFQSWRVRHLLPEVAWSKVALDSVTPLDFRSLQDGASFIDVPGVSFDTCENDFDQLLVAIEQGVVPITYPENSPYGVVEMPINVLSGGMAPVNWERIVENASQCQEVAEDLIRCFASKKEESTVNRFNRSKSSIGTQLLPNELPGLLLNLNPGMEANLFRKKRENSELGWEPETHLVSLNFDMQCLTGMNHISAHFHTRSMIVAFFLVLQKLEVNVLANAFDARLVTLSTGEKVLIHNRIKLKEARDPIDGRFWSKLNIAIARGENGDCSGTFYPLHFRDICEQMHETAGQGDYAHYGIQYFSPLTLPPRIASCFTLPADMAMAIDNSLEILENNLEGTWNHFIQVPREIGNASDSDRLKTF